jgi:hypothetical protein
VSGEGAPDNQASSSSPFLGRWYGWYAEGRELLLTVDSVSPDGTVEGTYAYGKLIHADRPQAYHIRGQIDGDVLRFAHENARQEYRLRPDGRLDLLWTKSDGSGRLVAVVHHLD